MGLLVEKVALRDVRDVDGFVNAALEKLTLTLRPDERDELEAEGIQILYDLAGKWDGRGTFSGYAGTYLGPRLLSAWHRMSGHTRPVVHQEEKVVALSVPVTVRHVCVYCGAPVEQPATGRRRRHCSDAHRLAHWRQQQMVKRNPALVKRNAPRRAWRTGPRVESLDRLLAA